MHPHVFESEAIISPASSYITGWPSMHNPTSIDTHTSTNHLCIRMRLLSRFLVQGPIPCGRACPIDRISTARAGMTTQRQRWNAWHLQMLAEASGSKHAHIPARSRWRKAAHEVSLREVRCRCAFLLRNGVPMLPVPTAVNIRTVPAYNDVDYVFTLNAWFIPE